MNSQEIFQPFAVLGRCWLHETIDLGSDLTVEPLEAALSFRPSLTVYVLKPKDAKTRWWRKPMSSGL